MPKDKMYKQFIAETKVDDDERTVTAVISTDTVDRDGEVMLPKGADLEGYLKNPVVQWAHGYWDAPIAKALYITKGRKQIVAKAQFADTVFAEEIYQLYKKKFLNAFSVGFVPKKSHTPTPDEIKKHPEWAEANRIYDEWELLEFSAVPVPANPEALATAVKTKEVSVSKELKEQLGIEDEETFYPAANSITDSPDSSTESPDSETVIDKVVVVTKAVDVKSKVSVGKKFKVRIIEPDYEKLTDEAIKRRLGIMY